MNSDVTIHGRGKPNDRRITCSLTILLNNKKKDNGHCPNTINLNLISRLSQTS